MSGDLYLARIDQVNAALAKVTTIDDAKKVIATAEALKVYLKRFDATIDMRNRAERIHGLALIRYGEILRETPKRTTAHSRGGGRKGSKRELLPDAPPVLPGGAKAKKIRMKAKILASLKPADREAVLTVPEGEELNINRAIKEVKEKRQRSERKSKRESAAAKEPLPDERIIVGDFSHHAYKIADGSLSLIFTDPPYDRKASKMLPALASFAADKLADGGSLLCYVGQTQIPAAMDAFRSTLRYWWTIACIHSGRSTVMREYGIDARWKAVLWFVKGTRDDNSIMVSDVMSGGQEKDLHPWQQAQSEAEYWIDKLCPVDGIVCDPFLGSGTTAAAAKALDRKWIGFEIDPVTASEASRRVS